jgi:hypothetical protein
LPGASAAGAVEYMPLTGTESTTVAFAADRPMPARGQEQRVDYASATPGYFPAMGVPCAQRAALSRMPIGRMRLTSP